MVRHSTKLLVQVFDECLCCAVASVSHVSAKWQWFAISRQKVGPEYTGRAPLIIYLFLNFPRGLSEKP